MRPAALLACILLAGGGLCAETSDYPLALNLPTADTLVASDLAIAFTHRFVSPVQGHGKDVYGADGYAFPGLGFMAGIKAVKGLNLYLYRTADNKTFVAGFQQRLLDREVVRMAVRAERFDEVVPRKVTAEGTLGVSGATVQVPTEFFLPFDVVFTLVPTWISRTTTQEKAVFNVGAGLRVDVTSKIGLVAEYYPRPAKVDRTFQAGFAAGVTYRTFKHRFSLLGTTVHGTTANQVLGGDYAGGPVKGGQWSLAFNVARMF
jgi:hypothetical protein